MATLTVKVLEADLRCIEPLMPKTFGACEVAIIQPALCSVLLLYRRQSRHL